MRLTRSPLDSPAVVNYTQVGHRHTAIEYAIAGISKIYDANLGLLGQDPLTLEAEGAMRDWVIETLLQGAYLREYHLWEKDCKAYFHAMARRNSEDINMNIKSSRPFTKAVKDALDAFGVEMRVGVLDAIEGVRKRVNIMKHDEGLESDHFIGATEYAEEINAFEAFWEHLAGCEQITR